MRNGHGSNGGCGSEGRRQQWREQTSDAEAGDRRGAAAQHGQNEDAEEKDHEAAIGSNCGWCSPPPVFFSFSRQMNSINCVFGSSVTSTVVPHGFVYAFASSMVIPMSM